MPEINWKVFEELPGDKTKNFEMLCRALIRRHYGQFGDFRALANQPGVEFHLKLHTSCSLGEPGRWYGWQCKWYDLSPGRVIGTTRRRQIQEAINITKRELPELTDWVLWTRYPLVESDQQWFFNLKTDMKLHLWTAAEVEEHLSGPAEIFRGTYFGELVLTPDLLNEKHKEAVEPIRGRWLPEVHQIVDAERSLRRALGEGEAWSDLLKVAKRLQNGVVVVKSEMSGLPAILGEEVNKLVETATRLACVLDETHTALANGDYEVVRQEFTSQSSPFSGWNVLLRRLRVGRYPVVLEATNLVANINDAHKLLAILRKALDSRLIAVVADAGYGKTQLAAQLTAPKEDRPAGILLYGRNLPRGGSLDELANRVVVNGNPVPSFEKLLAAVNAAGQRAGRRLPIIIDGLNEAEDPRDWKNQLASLIVTLERYPYVLVVCTLRPDFLDDAVPDGIEQLEIPGFGNDIVNAVRLYFQYYRIDPSDAELPWELLDHPLILKMFCEVTNSKRERTVGVESMPGSLTSLFERYLDQIAERIGQLSPRSQRYYESDVRTAINKIGLYLWEARARTLDLEEIRKNLGDDRRPWDQSIVRALEQEGILLRVSSHLERNHISFVYDALAGHIIADSLLSVYGGHQFDSWLRDPSTLEALGGDLGQRHPLASDIFRGLVGLVPLRMFRRQLWPLLDGKLRTRALYEAAQLDKSYLDSETVSQLAILAVKVPNGHPDLFDRLRITRSAQFHPLNAEFLDGVLRPMSMSERDLRWTEWVRRRQKEVLEDLKKLEQRWRSGRELNHRDQLRARWVMWTLTSTVRLLRDHATRSLYWFGCRDPKDLFELTLKSLEINDPYVPERMLAACYGVAMSLWADPCGDEMRRELPSFAAKLVDKMFVPEAPHASRHVLMRDYALGVIELATKVAPGCVPEEKVRFLKPPFHHIPSPFPKATEINDDDVTAAEGAIYMDFGNYTIGRLIPDRGNYDFEDSTYREVRRQIEYRIVQLGYTSEKFSKIDREIANSSWRDESRGDPKTDRYGKKYSWIAFFEMYGFRSDEGTLPEERAGERTSDADIDPSFPEAPRTWQPELPDLFTQAPIEPREWIIKGPNPNYNHLLQLEEMDGQRGPWVLLEGYIEQSSKSDTRRVFTFLRGLLVKHKQAEKLLATFSTIKYPGNWAIPEPMEDYYTYAGEIPWSSRFGSDLRDSDGKAKRDVRKAFDRGASGIPVEVPVYWFVWESYHSALNDVSGIMVLAPALCEQLHLSNRQGEWDLYDSDGRLATVYREFKSDENLYRSRLLYLRADLLKTYLSQTKQTLVWLLWGERDFKPGIRLKLNEELRDLWIDYRHIHRNSNIWNFS